MHQQNQTTCSSRPAPSFGPPGPSPMYQHLPSTLQPQHHDVNYSQAGQNFMTSPHGLITQPLSVHHTHATSSVSPYTYGEMNHAPAPLGGVYNYNNNNAYNSYSQQFHTFDMWCRNEHVDEHNAIDTAALSFGYLFWKKCKYNIVYFRCWLIKVCQLIGHRLNIECCRNCLHIIKARNNTVGER